ncbi:MULTISPECIES: AraC family transcriptional regulator [unclassified Acidisoma]
MSEGSRSSKEIGQVCGFPYVSHLTTAFGQATGLTPSQYRRLLD